MVAAMLRLIRNAIASVLRYSRHADGHSITCQCGLLKDAEQWLCEQCLAW